jgi:hypothetical protein
MRSPLPGHHACPQSAAARSKQQKEQRIENKAEGLNPRVPPRRNHPSEHLVADCLGFAGLGCPHARRPFLGHRLAGGHPSVPVRIHGSRPVKCKSLNKKGAPSHAEGQPRRKDPSHQSDSRPGADRNPGRLLTAQVQNDGPGRGTCHPDQSKRTHWRSRTAQQAGRERECERHAYRGLPANHACISRDRGPGIMRGWTLGSFIRVDKLGQTAACAKARSRGDGLMAS